jgi:hypothetical protein
MVILLCTLMTLSFGNSVLVQMCQSADCTGECLAPRAQPVGACFSLHGTVLTETVSCRSNVSAESFCVATDVFASEDQECKGPVMNVISSVCGSCVSTGTAGVVHFRCGPQVQTWSIGTNCSVISKNGECSSCAAAFSVSMGKCQFVSGVGNVRMSPATSCATLVVSLYERIYCQGPGTYALLPDGGCLAGTRYTCHLN